MPRLNPVLWRAAPTPPTSSAQSHHNLQIAPEEGDDTPAVRGGLGGEGAGMPAVRDDPQEHGPTRRTVERQRAAQWGRRVTVVPAMDEQERAGRNPAHRAQRAERG